MAADHTPITPTSIPAAKPYCIVGSGHLTAHLWKRPRSDESCVYRFNLFRTQRNGRVSQLLRPNDVLPLIKFVRVISQVIDDDGCISAEQRRLLRHLAAALDDVIDNTEVQQCEQSTMAERAGE